MSRLITILIAAAVTMTLLILKAHGQGKGHAKGHHKHEWKNDRYSSHDRYSYDKDHRFHRDEHHHYSGHHHVYHDRQFVHQHSRFCEHRVVVRHHERPRYVFYRDYEVYYDHHRNVFISYSGKGWTISANLPVHLRHINLNSEVCHSVDYYEDDFVSYLAVGRPAYGAVVHIH